MAIYASHRDLDQAMEKLGLFYVRFMDDILVLAPTRWKLRRAVKKLNETCNSLKLEKHPDKTFIGKIDKGFDFLGYHFSPKGLTVAAETLMKFVARATRLYEQERGNPKGSPQLGLYVRRWVSWVEGGLVADKKNPAGVGSFLLMRDQSRRSRMVSESVGNYPGKQVTHHTAPKKKFIPAEGGNK